MSDIGKAVNERLEQLADEVEAMKRTPCSRCRQALDPEPVRNAISRKDNTTRVCSTCGVDEGMRDFTGDDVWPGHPGVKTY